MIELIPDLPDNVLGFTAVGNVTGEDYETTVVPLVEEHLAREKKLRLLYVCGDQFTGFNAAAMWEDTKVGMRHATSWERIGVVTDVEWMRNLVKVLGFLMPGHVKAFEVSELEEAKRWICE